MSAGLDQLKKAANLKPIKKTVTLGDGSEFVFYSSPLTMAQRERAKTATQSLTTSTSSLSTCWSTKRRMRTVAGCLGRVTSPYLRTNEVRDEDLQALMLAVLRTQKTRRNRTSISKALERELERDNWMMLSFGVAKELGMTVQQTARKCHSRGVTRMVCILQYLE